MTRHPQTNAVGKMHSLLKKTEQPKLAEAEALKPTALERRRGSLRLISVGPLGYPTDRVPCLLSMATVA